MRERAGRGRLRARGVAPLALLLALAAAFPAAADDAGRDVRAKVPRWESNLSAGYVLEGRIGIVKSFWWYALPRVVSIGLSFDYVMSAMPLSANAALNAPLGFVTPFVSAGAGTNLTYGGITNYGGGLKIRLGRKFGLIAEYRRYHYTEKSGYLSDIRYEVATDYFGAGIAWLY